MPGLIEGASEGTGLGHQFLRHVERNRVLVHVVDISPIDESDPVANFELIERELKLYSEEVWSRPRIIALNKIDIVPHADFGKIRERFEALEMPLFPISGVTGDGVEALLFEIAKTLESAQPPDDIPVLLPALQARADQSWDVERTDNGYVVTGARILRMVEMTDLNNPEAVRYLHRRLERIGVIERLRKLGALDEDNVRIGNNEFDFSEER